MAEPADLRNIGIIAHIDAGKTTLSERILFYCQKIHRMGEVHDGAATMDYMPEEQERGITITSACTSCAWDNTRINLIDTPGHVDFTIEVERCLRVLDGAVGVFCAVGGVEPQSETVWRQSEGFKVPKIAFVNKMDRPGANFKNVIEQIRNRLGANAAALVIPLGESENFQGVIDLLTLEKITFDEADQGRTLHKEPLSENEKNLATPWRDELLEKLAEADEIFLEKWLEGAYSLADIQEALKRATVQRALTPVFCGSALRNIGVQPLLDGIRAYLPSPQESVPAQAHLPDGQIQPISADPNGSPLGLVFKVAMEGARKNCFVRLYSGSIREGDILWNARTGKQDRIGRVSRLHADRREQLQELDAGDIALLTGLRDAQTGDTIRAKNEKATLEPIIAYAPVLTLALEPRNADEGKILDDALNRYLQEDPTLKLSLDEDSGMRMLSGMGELHLEVVLERLEREYKIRPRSGEPQVVLRETVRADGASNVNFDKELGKERHQGEVALIIRPRNRGEGNTVGMGTFWPEEPSEARKLLPAGWADAIICEITDGLQSGQQGWPLADVEVEITAIKKTEGLTTLPGLRMAASQALRDAIASASPVTLEPIMEVEINCPEEFLGSALNLFNQTGGKVENLEDAAGIKRLSGTAPLRKLFGFSTSLRSATQGRAGFMQSFKKFDLA